MTRYISHRRLFLIFFYIFIFIPYIVCHANADSGVLIEADKQLDYADQLFKNNDYETAALEYKRFIHFFPNDERVAKAMYNIGVSYFRAGRHEYAITSFRNIIDRYPEKNISGQASFMMSRTYLAMGEPGSAVNCLYNLTMVTKDTGMKDRGFYEIGWIYLEHPWAGGRLGRNNGYELFPETGAADTAKTYFQKIEGAGREIYRIEELNSGIDRLQSSEWKNPSIAGALSIIPGAGQMYCGRYQDGIVAFILNAAFFFAAYESFTNDSPVLGGLISVVGAGFYVGNIYGAVGDAHKYNRRLYRYKVDDLKENFRVELSKKDGRPAVALSFNKLF
jgi:tetratricopeptide (TPR) repeat protein